MVVVIPLVVLFLLAAAGLATFAPWPYETFALIVAVTAACLTGVAADAFLAICAGAIFVLVLLTAKTIRQTLAEIASTHRVERSRRRRLDRRRAISSAGLPIR